MQVTNTLELSAVVWRENAVYVALCPEFDVASQGKALRKLCGILRKRLNCIWRMKTLKNLLKLKLQS
jgi:hypothetical protein